MTSNVFPLRPPGTNLACRNCGANIYLPEETIR